MAAKKESTFLSMVLTLLIITVVAATALAFIYEITKGPIKQAQLAKQKAALLDVLPEFDNDPIEAEIKVALSEGDSLQCYPAYKGNELSGVAVRANSKKGYEGEIWIIAGFKPEGSIHNSLVLNHRETPGLGDKMEKEKSLNIIKKKDGSADTVWWTKQFQGMKPAFADDELAEPQNIKVSKDGGEVDAITAATITSRAYCDALNRAYRAFITVMEKINAENTSK